MFEIFHIKMMGESPHLVLSIIYPLPEINYFFDKILLHHRDQKLASEISLKL